MKYRWFEEKAESKMTKYPKIGLSEMIDSPNGLIKMSALDRHRLTMIWP